MKIDNHGFGDADWKKSGTQSLPTVVVTPHISFEPNSTRALAARQAKAEKNVVVKFISVTGDDVTLERLPKPRSFRHVSSTGDRGASPLRDRGITPDNIEAAMVDRLMDLGRVPESFDVKAWLTGIEAQLTKPSGEKMGTHQAAPLLKDLGIYEHLDYRTMVTAHKATDDYKARMLEKPKAKAGKQEKDAWRLRDQEAGPRCSTSAPHSSPSNPARRSRRSPGRARRR